jgi:hypothetical protein
MRRCSSLYVKLWRCGRSRIQIFVGTMWWCCSRCRMRRCLVWRQVPWSIWRWRSLSVVRSMRPSMAIISSRTLNDISLLLFASITFSTSMMPGFVSASFGLVLIHFPMTLVVPLLIPLSQIHSLLPLLTSNSISSRRLLPPLIHHLLYHTPLPMARLMLSFDMSIRIQKMRRNSNASDLLGQCAERGTVWTSAVRGGY